MMLTMGLYPKKAKKSTSLVICNVVLLRFSVCFTIFFAVLMDKVLFATHDATITAQRRQTVVAIYTLHT